MSDFTKTFLRDRAGDDKQPREVFGIFGKHPGWNDHIEDLPLPTASMVAAKQLLYVQGIGSQISSGAWARLAESARLPDFDHVFLWVRGCQFLLGRMWGSRDGKKRAHFPMVAVVHAFNVSRDRALDPMLARLDQIASSCRAARTAEEVREIVEKGWPEPVPVPEEAGEPLPAKFDIGRGSALAIAGLFRNKIPAPTRVPSNPYNLGATLRFWSRICTSLAPTGTPLLFVAPLDHPWMDILACEPAPTSLFCLRAGAASRPVVGSGSNGDAPANEESDADEVIKATGGTTSTEGERSWISRFLGH